MKVTPWNKDIVGPLQGREVGSVYFGGIERVNFGQETDHLITQTPLNPNQSFLSEWLPVGQFTDLNAIVKCDKNLEFKVEFSPDMNVIVDEWLDSIVTTQTIYQSYELKVRSGYCRFILNNGVSTQSVTQLYVNAYVL